MGNINKFQETLTKLIFDKYERNHMALKKEGFADANIVSWYSYGVLPSLKNLEKILNLSTVTEGNKRDLSNAYIESAWETYKERKSTSNTSFKFESVLNAACIPEDIRKEWRERLEDKYGNLQSVLPAEFYEKENKNKFSTVLINYIADTKKPTFTGFIKELHEKWGFLNPQRFADFFGLVSDNVTKWINMASKNPPETLVPDWQTVERIANHKFAKLSAEGKVLLWQLCKGKTSFVTIEKSEPLSAIDKVSGSLEEKLGKYRKKIEKEKDFGKKDQLSLDLYNDLLSSVGFTSNYLEKKTKIKLNTLNTYSEKRGFLGGINCLHIENAFLLSQVFFPDSKELQNHCAAAFLNLSEHKDKSQIKSELLEGKLSINDAFLYTRLLVVKETIPTFCSKSGERRLHKYRLFEKGEHKPNMEAGYTHLMDLLNITEEKEQKKYLQAIKRNKPASSSQSVFTWQERANLRTPVEIAH